MIKNEEYRLMFHIFIFQSRKDKLKCELENVMVFLMWKSGEFFSTEGHLLNYKRHKRITIDISLLSFFYAFGGSILFLCF